MAEINPRTVEMETEKLYREQASLIEEMLPQVGVCYRKKNAIVTLFGQGLENKSTLEMMKILKRVKKIFSSEYSVANLVYLLNRVMAMDDIKGLRIDLGRLEMMCQSELLIADAAEKQAAVDATLKGLFTNVDFRLRSNPMEHARDVVLYGFGRIGRLLARLLILKMGSGTKLRLRAIVVRPNKASDLQKRADLLAKDSVHGAFNGTIEVDREHNAIIANGCFIRLLYAPKPDEVNYSEYGINDAILIDNTGIWRDKAGLEQHLKCPGIGQVILTAPGKGIPNVVAGVNDRDLGDLMISPSPSNVKKPTMKRILTNELSAEASASDDDTEVINASETGRIVSAASCTTNAVVPVLKTMNDTFGIVSGHLETIHSYTNDQNLIDNYHKKARRGRAAALNMVITETGAGTAIGKCLPELKGKLTANAIRVPTPNCSMAIMVLELAKETTTEEVNNALFKEAWFGALQNQIDITDSIEVTSIDVVGSQFPAVVDRFSTKVVGKRCNLYVWYDNEMGYSRQVIRVCQKLAGIEHIHFPASTERRLSLDHIEIDLPKLGEL